jgi:hypothetical protein
VIDHPRQIMSDALSNPTPQFGTAEYSSNSGSNRCRVCQQPMGGTYYRVNTAMVCPSCVEKLHGEMKMDTHAAFVRALAYGVGAAAAGLVGYALIAILLQGWVISYMSIGVGWLVGTAMMKGSNGAGGRRYQIVAALLTYAAVSMAAIPIGIHFAGERSRQEQSQQQKLEQEQRQLEQESGQQPSDPQPDTRTAKPPMDLGTWVVRLAMLGLASPLYELSGNPFWGVMGLLILFWGMRIAWRITAGQPFEVYGPFSDSAPASLTP